MFSKRLLTALVSRGYFPRELPATFTTTDFGERVGGVIADWEKAKIFTTDKVNYKKSGNRIKLSSSYTYKIPEAEIEIISKPKRGYERRNIHITHPLPQALLSRELIENWRTICKWTAKSKFTIDKLEISENFERSIKDINFRVHGAKKNFIEASANWIVQTDISRFYPSIYTHSIPWAAYGKQKVKGNLNLYKGSLGDRLDILVRACNRNQTIGIPIGPETSRILSEIISSRIDLNFSQRMPSIKVDSVDRLQDDWFAGAENFSEAENIISAITHVYRDYGLEINGGKTSIDRMIAAPFAGWRSELASFLSHKSGPLRSGRLKEFLDMGLNLQSKTPNDPVINYAMSVIEGQRYNDSDAEILESFLLKAAAISPISLDKICRVILNINNYTKTISKRRIVNRFRSLIDINMQNGNTYEVIWLLFTIRGLKKTFDSKVLTESLDLYSGSVIPLILLEMKNNGTFLGKLPISRWQSSIDDETIKSDCIWLLAYEGMRRGWLSDPNKLLSRPFFKPLLDRKIVFYDETRNVLMSSKANSERRRKSYNENLAVMALMKTLRGFNMFSEY
ncbi:RNA-directed DNA polymerase [Oleomonas cavernae]|uniref:RNA-directed DNA polymerase n=1 Tax=Oleomonas cavernae TaxID=2320859 RepID=A0A418VUK9_9PROT|nr:RNA-directed DNA polymerase [Oleomonas cavernae]RJF80836.1 RNA-directed DNA polymerase [Oleomonas cavernae]